MLKNWCVLGSTVKKVDFECKSLKFQIQVRIDSGGIINSTREYPNILLEFRNVTCPPVSGKPRTSA
jgi:hypothetical protein